MRGFAEAHGRRIAVFVLAATLAYAADAQALDRVGLVIGRLQGNGWQAEGVRVQLALARGSGELRATVVKLPAPVGELRDLQVRCQPLQIDDTAIHCPRARFRLLQNDLDAPDFGGGFRYEFATGALQFHVDDLPLGGTRIKASVRQQNTTWRAELSAPALSLSRADGTLASDQLALGLSLQAQPRPDGWDFGLRLDAPRGQLYVEPVFLDLAQGALRLETTGRWQGARQQLALNSLQIEQPGALRARGALALDLAGARRLHSLQLQIEEAILPAAYTRYLQPFLIGTVLDNLETEGRVEGRVDFGDGRLEQLRLELRDLHLDDKKRRFALYGASGVLDWRADPAAATVSRLRWEGGNAYRLDFGAAELQMHSRGRDLHLQAPLRIPLLDGGLDIRRFELAAAGTPDMRVAFDGVLAPVSMERLCRALDWPVFGGTLSGAIPTLEYRDGNLSVGGTLAANVFDGRVEVDQLRLEQPFGNLPRLSADMKIRRIDLEAATRAFSFGRIEGRLDGDVKNLRLLKWRPVAFDGRLYSSPGDDSRRRISQRAIENISDLGGGGAAGVLSRGFLRFFEDFAYDRIALGCRLQDGVCHMSGLEPHRSGGYYIVKGRLLPRIDVIGFATRVSWDSFVEQLKSATQSEGPVVK
ncbi:MAG TPA: hypothetical protein VNJ47_03980 [Nevskiales bacterium]|nr:hypothetical protein [Nevskiales bacterium]